MWIHTQFGFFSITRPVRGRTGYGSFQVRARLYADLVALISAAHEHRPMVPACPLVRDIIEGGGTDYKYRIIVDPSTLAGIMLMLVATTTYSNFKDKIAQTPGQAEKLHDMHTIWSLTLGWQLDEKPRAKIVGKPAPLDARAERAVGGGRRDMGGGMRVDSGTIPAKGGQHTNTAPMQGNVPRRKVVLTRAGGYDPTAPRPKRGDKTV